MKTNLNLQVACLCLLSACAQPTTTSQDPPSNHKRTKDGGYRYVVKHINRIIDGDTFDATLHCTDKALCTSIRIRIRDINCPELNGNCAEERKKASEAQIALHALLGDAQQIEIVLYPKDGYGRYLCYVYADGQNIGDMLLERGIAQPHYGKSRRPSWCE